MESAIASTRESGSSLASGCGHARALETLNFLTPKSFANHGILGSFSSFVLRMLPAARLDVLAAVKYALEVGFNEVDFSHCDFDARTRREFGQRRHPGVKG